MSWNNGNGYGQRNQAISEDTYNRMNNARDPGGARFPFIEPGKHRLAVAVIEKFMTQKEGPAARVIFKVLESTSPKHKPGDFVVKIYKLAVDAKFENSISDAEAFADLCMKLKNAPAGHPIGQDIRTLLEVRPADQLARGSQVDCFGVANSKGNWVNLYWTGVPQTPQDIVAMRQRLEAEGIPSTGPQQAPQGQAYAQSVPAGTTQYGQPPMQPQYGVPPGAQPGYGPTPQQQIQGAPNPAYYPGTPTNAPAAPQGGFLAQIPPQGQGGNQGGNGGGSGTW